MLTKLKKLLDPSKEEQWDERDHEERRPNLVEKEIERLYAENEQLHEHIRQLNGETRPYRMHLEFFYYHPNASDEAQFSEQDLDHFPAMCVTIHYMEENLPLPQYLPAMLNGLEDTLQAMKIRYRKVDEPQMYSLFVDTKLYPHQEVKKVMHVLIKQLHRLHMINEKVVTTRVHVGGDDLYEDLLDAYNQQD